MSDFDPRAGMALLEKRWFIDCKKRGFSDKKAREVARKMAATTSAERVAAGHSERPGMQAKTDTFNDKIKSDKQAAADLEERKEWLKGAGAVGRVTL